MFIACGFISLTTTKTIIPMVMYGKKMRLRTAGRYRLMAAVVMNLFSVCRPKKPDSGVPPDGKRG
jgi:hypothetical protein